MSRATYRPGPAWLKAGAYFAACLAIAAPTGALRWVLDAPLVTEAQRADPLWWLLAGSCLGVVVVGYGFIWPRGTFTDGRARHPLLAPAYGFVWGLCQALLFLSIWLAVARSGLAPGWVAVLSYLAIGGYNGLWHRFVWDIHVSPPHNYTEWNARKVLLCHTPNLILCLALLALYGSAGVFALLQGLALALSAWFMRFPAPWDDYSAKAGEERSLSASRTSQSP